MPTHFEIDSEPFVAVVDESIVVVRKPCRMHTAPLPRETGANEVAAPACGRRAAMTLCDWVFARFPDVEVAGEGQVTRRRAEGGLVHRLDFETSGLVLFARHPIVLDRLLAEQEGGLIKKEYLARVAISKAALPLGSKPPRGVPAGIEKEGWERALERGFGGETEGVARLVNQAVAQGSPSRIESRFRPYGPGSKLVACLSAVEAQRSRATEAIYETLVQGALAAGEGIELRLELRTGFRHQIRAHLAWVGLPILGDPLYGGRAAERLHLHARRLAFDHPSTGQAMVIEG